ncbi:MAG: type II toxin-antitoxin system prevent-host-death family antitoxin [Deltaproteobacteria bacterium]|nr:type II toxin-antitoxin system prevent-host-death family antitoxin [Deltaproteobacteria bacterium]
MLQVGAYEAKTRLSQLIDEAAKGEEIIITKHGVPVAALVPIAGSRQLDPQAAIAAIKDFRRRRTLAGLSLREMIEEGRL